jgi:hypothetical protein
MLLWFSPVLLAAVIYIAVKCAKKSTVHLVRFTSGFLSLVTLVYSLFTFSIGATYYGTKVADKMGIARRDVSAEELYNTSKEIGLAETLYGVFGNRVSVSIPFSKKDCDTNIEEIEFSVRAMHSLKRAGAFTVGAVIDLIANEGLLQIRNLGKKTAVEIKVRIMEFGYEHLTEKEKQAFFIEVVKKNCV